MIKNTTIHHLFEQQVEKTPNLPALRYRDQILSYEQLNQKSNQLAGLLMKVGCKRGSVVGVMLDKGIEAIIAMLGVLKAGSLFVILDQKAPLKHVDNIIEIAKPICIITSSGYIGKFTYISSVQKYASKMHFINYDLTPSENVGNLNIFSIEDTYQFSNKNPLIYQPDTDPAHIYFTSGSTGKPKGVTSPHSVLAHLVQSLAKEFNFNPKDIFSQLSVLSFDSSLRDIFVPLSLGASVAIPPEDIVYDSEDLLKWLEEVNTTIVQCVPTIFKNILNAIEISPKKRYTLSSVRYILVAGENIKTIYFKNWRDIVNTSTQLVNLYGTTETMVKSFYKYEDTTPHFLINVPIGRPFGQTQLLILKDNRLCEVGEKGELYIRTPYLSYGYLGDQERTNSVFIQNPLHNDYTDKTYVTGDFAKYLPDGNVLLLGRNDYQMKLNGVRIEPAEIENHLIKYKGIKDSVVLLKEENDKKELIAFIVSDSDTDIEEVRNYLIKILPLSHIPNWIIPIDKLPLTATNKVDRIALQKLEISNNVKKRNEIKDIQQQYSTYIPQLCAIWMDVFKKNTISVDDNFFEIGGDSLLAIQLVSRIKRNLKYDITLIEIFENPTIFKIASVLEKKKQQKEVEIRKAEVQSLYRASYAQQRLWMLSNMDEEGIAYNISFANKIKGPLDLSILQKCLDLITNRYEVLRTSFEMVNGELMQRVHDDMKTDLTILDFSIYTNKQIEHYWYGFLEKQLSFKFDLSKAPLMKVFVIKLSADSHIVFFQIHHTISDGWSINIIISELINIYSLLINNQHPQNSKLSLQYKDFATWQYEKYENNVNSQSLTYWKEQLSRNQLLDLPTDYTRMKVKSFEGAAIIFKLDSNLIGSVRSFLRNLDVSFFTFLLTSVKILLQKYSGQEIITVGTPVSGRTNIDLENQLGLFANTIVLVDEMFDSDTFSSALNKVKKTLSMGLKHQEYPFDKLVSELKIIRDTGRNPFFDTMVVMQKKEDIAKLASDIEISSIEIPLKSSKFDLTFMFIEEKENVHLKIEYDKKLYNKNSVELLYHHLIEIIKCAVKSPENQLSKINILTEKEKNYVLKEFNNTEYTYPKDTPLHRLFEKVVQQSPDNIAIVQDNEEFTYSQINQKANQLANFLKAKGLESGEIVGIVLEKSVDLIVGILGVLKAGGAFLPLDPNLPSQRIKYILEDSSAKIVIGKKMQSSKVKDILFVNIKESFIDQEEISNQNNITLSDSMAYVLYTSGTTGKPKGVVVDHIGIVNYIDWAIKFYVRNGEGNFPLFTSISFDLTLTSIFVPLLSGHTIFMYENTEIYTNLVRILKDKRINIIKLTPSHLRLIQQMYKENENIFGDTNKVISFIVGGENLKVEDALSLKRIFKKCEIFNEYGPTEAVVGCMIYKFEENFNGLSVPIGKPVNNTKIYILNSDLVPQPIGVIGEIYIARDGLSRGYLNQPELTTLNFINSPFDSNERLYKTGDLGRFLKDGNIEFCGRIDDQLKINGFRIEPAEIEKVIESYVGVKQAVIIQPDKENRLYGFIVTSGEIDIFDLKMYLNSVLPEYMVPSEIWVVPKMPLTTNGKINNFELLMLTNKTEQSEVKLSSDRGFETTLEKVWKSVLLIENVELNDNFFDIGGTSLKAFQVIEELKRDFGIELPIVKLFMHPNIKALSHYLQNRIEEENTAKADVKATKSVINKFTLIKNEGRGNS